MSMEALVLMTFFHTSLAVVSLVAWAGDLTEELVKERGYSSPIVCNS